MADLREWFNYDKDTGLVTRKKVQNRRHKVGEVCGSMNPDGYIIIRFNKKDYRVHRLAWLFEYGYMPDEIDHINRKPFDNRLINLREVNHEENSKNRGKRSDNTSGIVGVYWHKASNKWEAKISVDKKVVGLGLFAEFSEAVNARKNAEVLYGYHENHGKDL